MVALRAAGMGQAQRAGRALRILGKVADLREWQRRWMGQMGEAPGLVPASLPAAFKKEEVRGSLELLRWCFGLGWAAKRRQAQCYLW